MIAKPTLKTIPIAILLVLIVAGLGWMFGDNPTTSGNSPKTDQTSISTDARSRTSAPRSNRRNLRPANINVQERLQALYQKYPELNIPAKDPGKDLSRMYFELFPEEFKEQLEQEIRPLHQMLNGEAPWDPEVAHTFLAKHQTLIDTLIENSGPGYHFQDPEVTETFPPSLNSSLRLLTTCFGLQAKLGDSQKSTDTYRAAQHILQASKHKHLLSGTIAAIHYRLLNDYVSSTPPSSELIKTSLEFLPNSDISMDQLLIGEFTAALRNVYSCAVIDGDGDFTLGPETLPSSTTLPSLTKFEDTLASLILNQLNLLKTRNTLPHGEEHFQGLIQQLNDPVQRPDDPEAQQVLDLLSFSAGEFYDALQETNFISQTQQTALQIALAQSRGESFTDDLPLHYITGEPITWDQENNTLNTGLENEKATMDIPTISNPDQ